MTAPTNIAPPCNSAAGSGSDHRLVQRWEVIEVFRENAPGGQPTAIKVSVPIIFDVELQTWVLDENAHKIICDAKWPDTFASPFHKDYAMIDYEAYFGIWGDNTEESRKTVFGNYRKLLERAVFVGEPVSFYGWRIDLRNILPAGWVRKGDLLVKET